MLRLLDAARKGLGATHTRSAARGKVGEGKEERPVYFILPEKAAPVTPYILHPTPYTLQGCLVHEKTPTPLGPP